MGIGNRDRNAWNIDPRIRQTLRPNGDHRDFLKYVDSLSAVVEGSLMYYGLIPCDELYTRLGFSDQNTQDLMLMSWRSRWGFNGVAFVDDKPWFRIPYMEDIDFVLNARQEKEVAALDYAPITQEQALIAADRMYAGRDEDYSWFKDYVRKYGEV